MTTPCYLEEILDLTKVEKYLDVFIVSSLAVLRASDTQLVTIFNSKAWPYWREKWLMTESTSVGYQQLIILPISIWQYRLPWAGSFNISLNDGSLQLWVWDRAAWQTHISAVGLLCFDPNVNI